AIYDHRERVDRIAVDEDRHLDEVALLVAFDVIVEAGVAAAHRLQAIVEVEHHFVERKMIDHHRAVAGVGEIDLAAAAILAELEHRAEIFVRHQDRRLDPRLFDLLDADDVRHGGRIVQLHDVAVGLVDLVYDRRRGGDEIQVELALETLADDVEMEQP